MSLESFTEFINAAEHSIALRSELKQCTNQEEILALGLKYGFSINLKDLELNGESEKIEKWFKASKIPPIKKY